ncbi:MAG TPA: helix-turn-helix domain-containing protein, partial [Isosphaeraceae bacterium]|nr:helix-turn-helix domain-containing protein [Isosphaeraceae bacterium]
MHATLSIGDFARATHLSVKTLRHYHQIGLLEPADVDRHTGYRRYTTAQIPVAQVIRRFRDLDMRLDQIGAVLAAPDPEARNRLIATHLNRLEDGLSRTQMAVASLRDLLEGPAGSGTRHVGRRRLEATRAAAIIEV